jgi:hypothetical protein
MKRALAVLLAMTFLSLTATAAKKPSYVVSKRPAKRPGKKGSAKWGRSKKGGFAKAHNVKRKSPKPTKHAHR